MKKLFLFSMLFWSIAPAHAVIGESPEFRLDLRGLGPWQRHTAWASEPLAFSSSWATNAAAGAKAVVKVMPVLKTKPKYLVIDLSGGTSATHYPISYLDEVPGGSWSDEYKTSKLVLRHIPAGSFIMGGRATDYPGAVNTNLHMVTITRDFYMGVFEVTQRQWELVMGTRPSSFTNEAAYATRPVETFKWCDLRGDQRGLLWPESFDVDDGCFFDCIRRKTAIRGLDIPTEAQWEYACRAGTSSALYTGSNFTDIDDYSELNKISHNIMLSGWYALGEPKQLYIITNGFTAISVLWPEANTDTSLGTAKVGNYVPNQYGLYDLYGNVMEWCLDRYIEGCPVVGSIDPVGYVDPSHQMVARGNSFVHGVACQYSGLRSWKPIDGYRMFDLGFRLCLQGGDVPDFAAASTLVNESGTGSQSWTPTHSGAYYLTHSTMNGTTNVQLQSAWFEVPGCQLTLEPQGELTNGVSVAITGAGEGWTIYYTTNGLAPSKASTEYTGPFSLPESAMVRAVAYNAEGLEGEEVSETYTLHDALNVKSVVAHQRYPWNGKVDVDCEFVGDTNKQYGISLMAVDTVGNTNLPMATAWVEGTTITNTSFSLKPGKHRLVWDADADIAQDADYEAVAVKIASIDTEIKGVSAQDAASLTSGIVVLWQTNADAEKYKVYRVVEDGDDLMVGESTGNSFEDKTLLAAGTYSYYVRGVFGGKDGPASKVCAASCVRMPVCADPLIYLPLDGNVNNYGSVPCTFGKYTEDAAWLWLENRFKEEGRANYLGVNNRIAFPSTESFCVSNTFSVAFWAKSESVLSEIVEERASGNHGVISAKYPYVLYPNHGGDYGQSGLGIAVGTNGVAVVEHAGGWFPATLVFAGNIGSGWNHFVVTMSNNGAAILYVNGVKVRTGLVSEKVKKITNANLGGSANYGKYAGYVDDFMIYGRALSADEVRDLYRWDDPHVSDVRRVVFDPNGGSFEGFGSADPRATNLIERIYIGADVTYGSMPTVTKSGCKFLGWGISLTATKYVSSEDVVPKLGETLYAVWYEPPTYMVVDVSGGTSAASYNVSYLDEVPASGWTDDYKTSKIVLRYIPTGTFMYQGNTQTEITKGFYIGIFELTQKQWGLVTGNGSRTFYCSGDKFPANGMTDANAFINALQAKLTGGIVALPTEIQWEYACKAGTTTPLNSGKPLTVDNMLELGCCYNDYHCGGVEVGLFKPNNWGLYDMHGNLSEWCVSGSSLVYRGGGWNYSYSYCTSENRDFSHPSYNSYGQQYYGGARIVIVME